MGVNVFKINVKNGESNPDQDNVVSFQKYKNHKEKKEILVSFIDAVERMYDSLEDMAEINSKLLALRETIYKDSEAIEYIENLRHMKEEIDILLHEIAMVDHKSE